MFWLCLLKLSSVSTLTLPPPLSPLTSSKLKYNWRTVFCQILQFHLFLQVNLLSSKAIILTFLFFLLLQLFLMITRVGSCLLILFWTCIHLSLLKHAYMTGRFHWRIIQLIPLFRSSPSLVYWYYYSYVFRKLTFSFKT